MPIIKSAKKQMKQAEVARKNNREVKADFRRKVKDVMKDIQAGGQKVQGLTSEAYAAIDKAAKRNVIHKNTASRIKARLTLAINKSIGQTIVLASSKVKSISVNKARKVGTKPKKAKTATKTTKKTP